ncbi:MAG: histidine--tRNA ligase [Lachnospiraceae bacterium]|nr:histidine--tRNA ligase [Lachnospiraceae bacterium]
MAMIKKPVNGMKDILPAEMAVRMYVINLIRETYAEFGFSSIETPVVEHIENLLSKQGGENEKLIFKIMKRGEKLKLDSARGEEDLADSGLRYDLTLPLARYYANHAGELPSPFKALQIGPVFRADRPQRGRYRQFTQCDIDVLGDPSYISEIELILATTTVLGRLDFKGFTIRINDRKILKNMAAKAGFKEADCEKVFIILDKMDKIGWEGVKEELLADFPAETVEAYLAQFREGTELSSLMEDSPVARIIAAVEAVRTADFQIVFDPTLVRGMGYYTGPIFEIAMDEFGGSVGGGGRYDEMIGRFTGQNTPAVGFSIGFERIVMLLMEKGFQAPNSRKKMAFLIEKKMPDERLTEVFREAEKERAGGKAVAILVMKKNKKFQKEQLAQEGYEDIREFFAR